MSISLFSNYANMLDSKQVGELWRPKAQRLRVGDNIGAITATSFQQSTTRNVVVANGDDVAFKSLKLFNAAKSAAQSGFNIKTFRDLSDEQINSGAVVSGSAIYDKGDRIAFIQDDKLVIFEKKQSESDKLYGSYDLGEKLAQVKLNGDVRVSWDAENNPVIHQGAQARTNGKLQAQSGDEILIRRSGADVVAGEGSVVFNMSDREGVFSGGQSATFLGAYTGSTFKDLGGGNIFAGYFNQVEFSELDGSGVFSGVFEESVIATGNDNDEFSGYFSSSEISGGNGKNIFNGLFLNESKITGGADEDKFNGRFIASRVDGGAGDDVFGNGVDLNNLKTIRQQQGQGLIRDYQGLEADFIDTQVEGGEGNDKFESVAWGGGVNLGEGDDASSGVFTGVMLDGGAGNDRLTAMYAAHSVFFTGLGNDKISLGTSVTNVVKTDEGENTVNLGNNRGQVGTGGEALGGDHKLLSTTWQTPGEFFNNMRPLEYGEQRSNYVDAAKGENTVNIRNGQGEHQVRTGTVYEEEEGREKGEPAATEQRSSEDAGGSDLANQAGRIARNDRNGQQLLEATLSQAGLDGNDEQVGKADEAEQARRRKAIGRYVSQSGDAPLAAVGGGLAAVVHTGQGEDLKFSGIERKQDTSLRSTDPGTGMLQTRRRGDGFGMYVRQQFLFS